MWTEPRKIRHFIAFLYVSWLHKVPYFFFRFISHFHAKMRQFFFVTSLVLSTLNPTLFFGLKKTVYVRQIINLELVWLHKYISKNFKDFNKSHADKNSNATSGKILSGYTTKYFYIMCVYKSTIACFGCDWCHICHSLISLNQKNSVNFVLTLWQIDL